MTVREIDKATLESVTAATIYDEIHRLEGRMDFLFFCSDIPEDIKKREFEYADRQMTVLQAKLMTYRMRGEI